MPRRRNNNNKKKNKNVRRRNRQADTSYRMQTGRKGQMATSKSELVDMPWTDDGLTAVSALTTYLNFRYRGNSPFDPNPNIGGASALYFATYSLLYRRYRTLTVVVDYEIVNNENFPIFIAVAPTSFDISGTIVSNVTAANVGELPMAKRPRLLAPKGGQDRLRDRLLVHWPTFIGNKQAYFADDSYSSLNNTNPVNNMFIQFAVFGTGLLTLGITANIRLSFRTLWTDFNYSINLFRQPQFEMLQEEEDSPETPVYVTP